MKKILIATLALGLVAGPALAAPFPEKAESKVRVAGSINSGIVTPEVPLKQADQMLPDDGVVGTFDSEHALAVNDASTPFYLKTPNR